MLSFLWIGILAMLGFSSPTYSFSATVSAFSTVEDCVRFNRETLHVRNSGRSRFFISDGKRNMMSFRFRDNAAKAYYAMIGLNMGQECYLNREEEIFQYFLTPFGDAPSGQIGPAEICEEIDGPLEVVRERRFFRTYYHVVLDADSRTSGERLDLLSFRDSDYAYESIAIIERHGFSKWCVSDRQRQEFSYFRR